MSVYLEDLQRRNAFIPRYGNKLNRSAIARASGVERNHLYTNHPIVEMLEARARDDVGNLGLSVKPPIAILEENRIKGE